MLKNEDLKQISSAITLLTTIKLYLLEIDTTDFIDKTGVDLIDIQRSIKNLNTIHTQEVLKHIKQSEKSNAYNKAHPEKHREINRRYEKRKKEKAKNKEVK